MKIKAISIALLAWVSLQVAVLVVDVDSSCGNVYAAQVSSSNGSAQKKVKSTGKTTKGKVASRVASDKAKSKKSVTKSLSKNSGSSANQSQAKRTPSARVANKKNPSIEELKSSINKVSRDRRELQAELKKSEKQIISVRNNLRRLQQKREKVKVQLRGQKEESIRLEAELAHEQKVLEEINRQRIQELASRNTPSWSSDAYRSERAEVMLRLLAQKSRESIARLDKKQKELAIVLAQANENQKVLINTVNKEQSEQERLKKERLERQRTVARLDKELLVKETTLKKLQADERRLGTLVAKLQKQEKTKGKNPQLKDSVVAKAVNLKGSYPVDGRIVARFGEKRKGNSDLGTWKGTVFSVSDEKAVRSVRPGQVVFSDYLRGYGNLIIIKHDGDYYSVYGNNALLEKDIGDKVKQGEEISKVGNKESDVSILYFEVRHKGKPIDPASWLNI